MKQRNWRNRMVSWEAHERRKKRDAHWISSNKGGGGCSDSFYFVDISVVMCLSLSTYCIIVSTLLCNCGWSGGFQLSVEKLQPQLRSPTPQQSLQGQFFFSFPPKVIIFVKQKSNTLLSWYIHIIPVLHWNINIIYQTAAKIVLTVYICFALNHQNILFFQGEAGVYCR